jgi:hypothetical protein
MTTPSIESPLAHAAVPAVNLIGAGIYRRGTRLMR